MNSKIAKLLTKNITNDRVVAEMIMYVCNKDSNVEDRLINLCLGTDADFVTKGDIIENIDKIKPLCMAYTKNIESVSYINVAQIDNIDCSALIEFKAKVTAWFENQEAADSGDSWYSTSEKDDKHKIKGAYERIYSIYVPFKDIDIDVD